MKKIAFILIVLTLSRVAVAYAVTPSPSPTATRAANSNNYFFGNSTQSNSNLNQVLALLVGPKGDVGPAGVAGKDGFVGLNGQDGKDGLPGAPGAVGPAGPAGKDGKDGLNGVNGAPGAPGAGGGGGGGSLGLFAVIPIATGVTDCNGLGGTKIIGVDGTPNFVCNGAVGANAYSLGFADGTVALGNCQPANETVTVTVDRAFDGEEFRFTSFNFANVSTACAGKRLSVNMKMAPTVSSPKPYAAGEQVVCTTTIAAPTPANPTRVNDGTATCRIWRGSPLTEDTTTAVTVSDVNTLDFTGAFGFQLKN